MTDAKIGAPRPPNVATREARRIIEEVAKDAGVTPAQLLNGRNDKGRWKGYRSYRLSAHRWLAIALCTSVYGVDDYNLGRIFNMNRTSLPACRPYLLKKLENDPNLRDRFDRLCESLGYPPLAAYDSWEFPEEKVREILRAVGAFIGVSGSELVSFDGRVHRQWVPYRGLAMDLCLRLPGMNVKRLCTGLRTPANNVFLALEKVPMRLQCDPALRRADQQLSAQFNLQPREEWY